MLFFCREIDNLKKSQIVFEPAYFMQQALSSCTGFAPSPWPFLSGLVFFLSVVPFFTAYAVLFTFLPLTNTVTHTHSPFAKQFFLLHLLLFRAVSIFLFCLLLPFATLSLCFMLRQMALLCCWNFLFVDFSLFLSTLIASFLQVFFFSCWYFHLLFLAQHAFLLAQNDLFHFLELTNTAKSGWNGNFVQISLNDDPAQKIRLRFTKSTLWLNCKGVEPRKKT